MRQNEKKSEEGREPSALLMKVRYWCERASEQQSDPLYLASREGDIEGARALLTCTEDIVCEENEFVMRFMKRTVTERVNQKREQPEVSA